jgi:FkbM family methyltransferase
MTERFSSEVNDQRVHIVNACISPRRCKDVAFYVNLHLDKMSTSIKPEASESIDFDEIIVRSLTASEIISQFGPPLYVKIDLEGADCDILKELFTNYKGTIPYISAELFKIDGLSTFLGAGYSEYKVVEGRYVHYPYYDLPAERTLAAYRFERGNAAGPFGEDIPGEWMTSNEVLRYLMRHGLGWRDLHARHRDVANLVGGLGE